MRAPQSPGVVGTRAPHRFGAALAGGLVAVGTFAGGCGAPAGCGDCGPCSAVVARVIDGDTIELAGELAGGARVRYLLVDTPESTGGRDDCYGAEAASFNEQLVAGRTVELRYDERGCRDRYGRLLAYVTTGGREVNQLLVERGYACVLFIPPAGSERALAFEAAEADARARRAGLWGACQPVPCRR